MDFQYPACPDDGSELRQTQYKYEGKNLFECPMCGDEFTE